MSSGEQLWKRTSRWKGWMLGRLLINPFMQRSLTLFGPSKLSDFQMDWSKVSKGASVLEVTNKRKESNFIKHMLQLFSGLPFGCCWSWKFCLGWPQSRAISQPPFFMHCLDRMSISTVRCHLASGSLGKVLKLKKTLYGLCQFPCVFWKYLFEKMASCGMVQSKLDPCLFVGEKVICISYVDDLIFWTRN